jgi:putative intracellular protease/amidase
LKQRSGVKCDDDIVLNAHYDFNDSPELDYLIIPGGRGRREQVNNERLIAFIKDKAKISDKILSVCTGMFLLHNAGLLRDTPSQRPCVTKRAISNTVNEEARGEMKQTQSPLSVIQFSDDRKNNPHTFGR